jgi:hypothetical protein
METKGTKPMKHRLPLLTALLLAPLAAALPTGSARNARRLGFPVEQFVHYTCTRLCL